MNELNIPGQDLLTDDSGWLTFTSNNWLTSWKKLYEITVVQGNFQYEYDQRQLLMKLGYTEDVILNWRKNALTNAIGIDVELVEELYRTYVPREAPEKGKRRASKAEIAKSDTEEGIAPVFGQLLPPKKTRKRKV